MITFVNFRMYKYVLISFFILLFASFSSFGQTGTITDYINCSIDIPDNDGTFVSAIQFVGGAPSNAIITEVKIYYEIKHTYPGDLDVWMTSYYDGYWHDYYLYHQGDLGSTDDIVAYPYPIIHEWDGALANQTWYLSVEDKSSTDTGYIEGA